MTIFTAASDPGRAGGPGCDEPPTKLKVRVTVAGGWRPERRARAAKSVGLATPAQGAGRAAPNGRSRRRRRAACPPCRAAPTSAGCTPPLARTRHAGRGGRRCRAATRPRAISRGSSSPRTPHEARQPTTTRTGGARSTVKPAG